MHIEILLLYIAAVVNILLGILVLSRTYTKLYGWFFACTMVAVALWAVGDSMILTANDPEVMGAAKRIFYIAPMLIPVCIGLFAFAFPSQKFRTGWLLYGSIPFGIAAGILAFAPNLVVSNVATSGSLNTPEVTSFGFTLYAAYFSISFLIVYITLYKKYRSQKNLLARDQLRYTLFGVIAASVPALITNLTLPLMGHGQFIWLGPLFTTVFVATIAYNIIQHKMFDMRLVIARSLGYIATLTAVALLYGFVIFGLARWMFNLDFSLAVQVYASITTALASLAFGSLKRFFDRVTDKLFYRDNYDTQELFDQLNKLFVTNADLDHMLKRSARVLQDTFKTEFCFFGIKESEQTPRRIIGINQPAVDEHTIEYVKRMTPHIRHKIIVTELLGDAHQKLAVVLQSQQVAVLSRLTTSTTTEGIGYLVLGNRRSGNPYTTKDVQTLEIIVNELVIAIQNSLHFEQIQNFNNTLQQKVDDATKKLRHNNDKLKELDNTKDDFISMASHQLRTPLTSVKGYLSMVLDGDAGNITETQRKLLNQAYVSSQRMVYTIADLLNVSRLKTGKFVIERSPVNLADVVQQEISSLIEAAAAKDIALSYVAPDFCPPLMLDDTKIRQVIMNFIDNAIYYTPPRGTIAVEIMTTNKMLELRVVDTGMGVPKAAQPHMFTKFYRASNAQKARPDGTGLGLFMAKKIIIAQGGSVIFKSIEGKGSTFGFSFPLVRE